MAGTTLNDWGGPDDDEDLDGLLQLTERSLKEVKSLTEYEDQKAQRILAAEAFLAALAGALFALVFRQVSEAGGSYPTGIAIVVSAVQTLAIGLFYVYAFLVVVGAAAIIYAIRPKFNVPNRWDAGTSNKLPKSFLFFEKILEPNQAQWAEAFTGHTLNQLKLAYIKNAIFETWVVAEKIDYKVRLLKRGVAALFISNVVLAVWIVDVVVLAVISIDTSKATKTQLPSQPAASVVKEGVRTETPLSIPSVTQHVICACNEKARTTCRPANAKAHPQKNHESKTPNCGPDGR
jgi:hypothetical protein